MAPDLELNCLGQFYGTQQYYSVLGSLVTDGIKYIMDNGYSWFVTGALAVIKAKAKLRKQPFLSIKLKLRGKGKATMTIEDGNYNVLYEQHYNGTNAKRELTLFFAENVLMLNSEW